MLLELADDSRTARAVIPGLKQLGTRAAKDKLAELAEPKNPEWLTQPAIEALARLGDGTYCLVMLGDSITARKQAGEVPETMEVVDVSQLLLRSVKQPVA